MAEKASPAQGYYAICPDGHWPACPNCAGTVGDDGRECAGHIGAIGYQDAKITGGAVVCYGCFARFLAAADLLPKASKKN